EGEYRVPYISHAVLEPHICVAYLDGYERLIVVSSTQVPYHTRRQLAAVLQLPIARIRVVKPRVGGGFGSKQEMLLEPVAAALTGHIALPSHAALAINRCVCTAQKRIIFAPMRYIRTCPSPAPCEGTARRKDFSRWSRTSTRLRARLRWTRWNFGARTTYKKA